MHILLVIITLLTAHQQTVRLKPQSLLQEITVVGLDVNPQSITSGGDVVGYVNDPDISNKPNFFQAFRWSKGNLKYRSPHPQHADCAFASNTRSEMVGFAFFREHESWRACRWKNGLVSSLPALINGNDARAVWINDGGDIVGWSDTTSSYSHATLWSKGTVRDIGTLGGKTSEAHCISIHGTIVGIATTTHNINHPFVFNGGTMTDLLGYSDGSGSASFVNDKEEVVGFAHLDRKNRAFYWKNGKITYLPTLGGDTAQAMCINNRGLIVGWAEGTTINGGACLWRKGVPYDLNKFVPKGMELELIEARGINDKGQVTGLAYKGKNIPGQKKHSVGFILQLPSSLLK